MHRSTRERFGWDHDNYIGATPQPNPWSEDWVAFFRDRRLLYTAREGLAENRLPKDMFARLETLAERLDEHLIEPEHPSLIHGDIWNGNVLVRHDRIAAFIDPAVYFADREIELAFTTMFGTFGEPFFEAYEDILPLKPGFHELRRDIYNLYPTLVHVRLFGEGYLAPIEETLARLGF